MTSSLMALNFSSISILSKPPGDVIIAAFVFWMGEEVVGLIEFHEFPEHEESGVVGDAQTCTA